MNIVASRNIKAIGARPNILNLPDIKLPFFPRSVLYQKINQLEVHDDAPENTKDFIQIFWVIEGEAEILINDRYFDIGPGYVAIRKRNKAQYLRITKAPYVHRWITFDGPEADKFVESYNFPDAPMKSGNCPHQLFIDYANCIRNPNPYNWKKMVAIIVDLLAHINSSEHRESDSSIILLHRAMQCCNEHFQDSSLNVNELATYLNVDRSTLQRTFKKNIQMSPLEYITKLRVENATLLLKESTFPLADIFKRCGFLTQSYFTKVFHKQTQMTPNEFRQNDDI